jgi:hypothetical protein
MIESKIPITALADTKTVPYINGSLFNGLDMCALQRGGLLIFDLV